MKKTAIALTLILAVLFSTCVGVQLVVLTNANPVVVPIHDVTIELPENKTYAQNSILVTFSYSIPNEPHISHDSMQSSFSYVLDGKETTSFSVYEIAASKLPDKISYEVHSNITDLPDGTHTLVIHVAATADQGFTTFAAYSKVAAFTINTISPSINPTPTPESKPFSNTWILAGIIIVVVGVGFLIYFRKRNGGRRQ